MKTELKTLLILMKLSCVLHSLDYVYSYCAHSNISL